MVTLLGNKFTDLLQTTKHLEEILVSMIIFIFYFIVAAKELSNLF